MVDEHENVIIVHLLKMEARQAVGQSRVANCQDSHLPPPTPRNKITAIFFIVDNQVSPRLPACTACGVLRS